MKNFLGLLIIGFILTGCGASKNTDRNEKYKSENLIVRKISGHVYQHTSFLHTESFGKVPCNGMIVFDGNEALVFDTPADDKTAEELINWINDELNAKITAVVCTHFHADCVGGLAAFHAKGIPSYALNQTIGSAKKNKFPQPQNGFTDRLELGVGKQKVYAEFMGEGHTKDNIIAYFPSEKILFGGCLIKEIGAGKGNLEDANVSEWPQTVRKVKAKYPNAEIIIPGHGKPGGMELLDYTIKLFE